MRWKLEPAFIYYYMVAEELKPPDLKTDHRVYLHNLDSDDDNDDEVKALNKVDKN
jgi:hypothetical protein